MHPLFKHHPRAAITMRFIRLEELLRLSAPLPRCQDLPDDVFGVMRSCDKLVAVSHGWRFQVHPDPYGAETATLRRQLRRILDRYGGRGTELYVFLDFLAIPQRPFKPGQADRSDDEEDIFHEALLHLDAVFLYADFFVHVDMPMEVPRDDGELYFARPEHAPSLGLREVGGVLQCADSHAFDSLLAVNGILPDSAMDAEALLNAGGDLTLSLERHQYGLPNRIACSDRGWIYLERFITMVVAAMVKDSAFEDMVSANSPELLREIHAGAAFLRSTASRAARQRAASVPRTQTHDLACIVGGRYCCAHFVRASWEVTLDSFEERLKQKQFSAASIDKSLNPALRSKSVNRRTSNTESTVGCSDAQIVAEIMRNLVADLAVHWEAKQAQRLVRQSVVETLRTYVVDWNSFTPGYMQRIQDNASRDCLFIVFLALAPLVLMLGPLLLPYQPPDRGWRDNWLFLFVGEPWLAVSCFLFIPQWIQLALNMPLPRRCTILWPVITALVTGILCPTGFSMVTGIFPCPFTPVFVSFLCVMCLPGLWLLLPRHMRSRRAAEKFIRALVVQVGLTFTFCIGYPFLNVALQHATQVWETATLGVIFLGVRIAFEHAAELLAEDLGPDVKPAVVFMAELAYQAALCDFFRNASHWFVFALFVGMDVVENIYYLFCFMRCKPVRPKADIVASDVAVAAGNDATPGGSERAISKESPYIEDAWRDGFCDGGAASVAAVLLVRELADCLAPTTFSIALVLLYWGPGSMFNDWVATAGTNDIFRTLRFLLIALIIEFVMVAITFALLRSKGLRPLSFLRGVVVGASTSYYMCAVSTAVCWYGCLQLAHNGCDFSFRLHWLTGGAEWRGGLLWEPHV